MSKKRPHIPNQKAYVSQPQDWYTAFRREAKKRKMSLSEWMGERCRAGLDPKVSDNLSQRRPQSRPRKDKDEGLRLVSYPHEDITDLQREIDELVDEFNKSLVKLMKHCEREMAEIQTRSRRLPERIAGIARRLG